MEGPLWPSSCFWRTRGTPTMRMRDKVALVTGAGSGIGRATALRLAAEGARVACADSNQDAAAETAARIAGAGGDALTLVADVTDDGACARMVEAAPRPLRKAHDARELGGRARGAARRHAAARRVAACRRREPHRDLPRVPRG